MTKLNAICYDFGAIGDPRVGMEFGFLGRAAFVRAPLSKVLWQVPPQVFFHAFRGINEPVNGLLAHSNRGLFINQTACDLLGRPAIFDTFDDELAQFRISHQPAVFLTTCASLHQCD